MEIDIPEQILSWITGFEGGNGGTEKLVSQNAYIVTSHEHLNTNMSSFRAKKVIYFCHSGLACLMN